MSWYLKYRPQTLLELDQESVRSQVSSFVLSGRFPHALLFSGPKGTGKTSTARIIAKILNCEKNKKKSGDEVFSEPCNECISCKSITGGISLSVIELDAASNRGIEDIRAIREAVKLSTPELFRVYILDEAHMLTTEAANALLKTLEEPPPHVVFILATTAPDKIPDTIKSRTTRINFKKASRAEIEHSLARVIRGEKLKLDKEMFAKIVAKSGGSFRDAIKILEQTSVNKNILGEEDFGVDEFLRLVGKKDMTVALTYILELEEKGVSMRSFQEAILARLHDILLLRLSVKTAEDVDDLKELESVEGIKSLISLFSASSRQISFSPIPSLPIELVVLEWCNSDIEVSGAIHFSRNSPAALGGTDPRGLRAVKSGDFNPLGSGSDRREVRSSRTSTSREGDENKGVHSSPVSTSPKKGGGKKIEINDEVWKGLLESVKSYNHTIAALLRGARPVGVDGKGVLRILVFYPFHKERLEETRNREVIETVLTQILGRETRIEFDLGEKPAIAPASLDRSKEDEARPESLVKDDEDLAKVAEEIFGNEPQQH